MEWKEHETWSLEARVQFWLCQLLALWSWTSVTSLSTYFLSCSLDVCLLNARLSWGSLCV